MHYITLQVNLHMPVENKTVTKLVYKEVTYKDLFNSLEEELGHDLDDYVYVMWNSLTKFELANAIDVQKVTALKEKKTKHCKLSKEGAYQYM